MRNCTESSTDSNTDSSKDSKTYSNKDCNKDSKKDSNTAQDRVQYRFRSGFQYGTVHISIKIPFRVPIRIPILRIPIWGRPGNPPLLSFLLSCILYFFRGGAGCPSPFFFWGKVLAAPLLSFFLSGGRAGPPRNSFLGFLLVVFHGETCIPERKATPRKKGRRKK